MGDIAVIPGLQPVVGGGAPARNPDGEVERLRRVIEKQPGCLLRVAFDGLLLAVNDAALQMLGTRELGDALGRCITDWIVPDHRERWQQFAVAVRDTGSGSAECDMADPAGTEHPVCLQGVWLADHPDGVVSLIVLARDLSGTRRLEEAVLEHARVRGALADAQQRLQQALADRARMQALADEHDLGLLIKEREGRRRVEELQRELDEARANSRRGEASVAEMESARQHLLAAHEAEMAGAERDAAAARSEAAAALNALADQRVLRQSLDAGIRNLEPLAAAGRLALEVGPVLRDRLAAVDARAKALLARYRENSVDRHEFEALVLDAGQAASLTRQMVLRAADPVEDPARSGAEGPPREPGRIM